MTAIAAMYGVAVASQRECSLASAQPGELALFLRVPGSQPADDESQDACHDERRHDGCDAPQQFVVTVREDREDHAGDGTEAPPRGD